LLTVRGDAAYRKFNADGYLAEFIVRFTRLVAIKLIAKYKVILVGNVYFNRWLIKIIKQLKLIANTGGYIKLGAVIFAGRIKAGDKG